MSVGYEQFTTQEEVLVPGVNGDMYRLTDDGVDRIAAPLDEAAQQRRQVTVSMLGNAATAARVASELTFTGFNSY